MLLTARKSYCLLLIATLFLLVACKTTTDSSALPALATADGHTFDLNDHADKLLFINYWAPWCAPCREEIPALNGFMRDYKDKALVLGVHLDAVVGARLIADIKEMGIEFPVIIDDPVAIFGLRSIPVVPVTWLLHPMSKYKRLLIGPQTQQDLILALEEWREQHSS